MMLRSRILLIAAALSLAGCAPAARRGVVRDEARDRLRLVAAQASIDFKGEVRGEKLGAPLTLGRFYEARSFAPAWTRGGRLLPAADALLVALRRCDRDGLAPSDYHLATLESLVREWKKRDAAVPALQEPASGHPVEATVDLDLLLTDAFLTYGAHALGGKTNAGPAGTQWMTIRRKADLAQVLDVALSTGALDKSLEDLQPAHMGYFQLKEALARYRRMSRRDWVEIAAGPPLKKGATGPRVEALRRRLVAEGYAASAAGAARDHYDQRLADAVVAYQKRNGLEPDGAVGPGTLAVLNVPLDARIEQIKVNMDRWRWLPPDLGDRAILVNVPEFMLYASSDGARVFSTPVIVGKSEEDAATPIFSDEMTYLEFSPYWNVPHDIGVNEILPAAQADPDFLADGHFEVLRRRDGDEGKPIDPSGIDWSEVNAERFPYRFRQKPGPHNALGVVKFMFPNQFNIYIHATPSDRLFARRERAFSHGCVRVKLPFELAKFVLDDAEWTDGKIRVATQQAEPHLVPLRRPIPVYLMYWTVWIDENDASHFRRDIYGWDFPGPQEPVAAPPPVPSSAAPNRPPAERP